MTVPALDHSMTCKWADTWMGLLCHGSLELVLNTIVG